MTAGTHCCDVSVSVVEVVVLRIGEARETGEAVGVLGGSYVRGQTGGRREGGCCCVLSAPIRSLLLLLLLLRASGCVLLEVGLVGLLLRLLLLHLGQRRRRCTRRLTRLLRSGVAAGF